MTLQNRVQPDGQITATPMRGLLMGNRGILHDENRRLGKARWKGKAWITCVLSFKGRRRELMTPGRYTELFFLDEAVALAAGHRPCFECRRNKAREFKSLWLSAVGPAPRAADIDAKLHKARTAPQIERLHMGDVPGGSMVLLNGQPHLVLEDRLHPYMPEGYAKPIHCPDAIVAVLTPAPVRAVLRAGYTPLLHPSAQVSQDGLQD